jgi:mRNA interferase RelE/StbE
MAKYKILFKESVYKDIRNIPKAELKRILLKIEQLAEEPRPIGSQKLTGFELFRVRQGAFRIVYSISDNELIICVIKIGHRKDVYR